MKLIINTKSIWFFVLAFLSALPVSADYIRQEKKITPFTSNIFEDDLNKDIFNQGVFNQDVFNQGIFIQKNSTASDDDPNDDEDWIGKATPLEAPVGDALWLVIALVFPYGYILREGHFVKKSANKLRVVPK